MKINEPKRIRPPSVGNNSEKRERTGGKLYFYFPRIGSKVGRAGVGPMRPLVLKKFFGDLASHKLVPKISLAKSKNVYLANIWSHDLFTDR